MRGWASVFANQSTLTNLPIRIEKRIQTSTVNEKDF